jgi:hypothetical protein
MAFKSATPLPALHFQASVRDGLPVVDTNTLREAALRASWQRDQRVSRRRLAVRWLWWSLWKYRFYLAALLAAVLAFIFWPFQPSDMASVAPSSAVTAQPAQPAPSVPSSPSAPSGPTVPDLQLRIESHLLDTPRTAQTTGAAPEDSVLPPSLKLDTRLTIKETTP